MNELIIMQDTVNVMPEEKLNEMMSDSTKEWERKASSSGVIYYKQVDKAPKPEEIQEEPKETK